MARSRYTLTPALAQLIVSYVRAGGYPWVCAEAAGLPREVFADWMRRGEEPGGRSPYREFRRDVLQAHAQARLKAEVAILTDRPLDWLKFGPGKEMAEAPGWTGPARPRPTPDAGHEFSLADPAVQALLHTLLQALEPYPEAREVVGRAMRETLPLGDRFRDHG
jgi:hypothetical protein